MKVKCYVVLFLYLVIKTIHLELVSDLSVEAFFVALRVCHKNVTC